jgi:DNA polymerase-3 subunit delta'
MGFDSFFGNPQAVAAVREILGSGRMPGAMLFAGPDGVGKKTLALMLAKALVCEHGPRDFCNHCARCRKADQMFIAAREDLARRREIKEAGRRVEGLVYFDLQLIEPLTKFILTDQIRQLRAIAYTRPFELPRRIFIIDDAQTIHWQAVDLMLKVLEEPPETTSIILVCPNAYELRSTIRSRCLRIPFSPVDEPLIQELLAREKDLTPPQQALAARVAAGSVARARAFDPAEYERRRKPWLDFLEATARRLPPGTTPDWRLLLESARALNEDRDDFEETLRIGYSLLADLLYVWLDPTARAVVNLDLHPRLRGWAAKLKLAGIERLKSGLDQTHRLQVRNVNSQLGFETLGIEVISASESGPR